ncbi:MAG: hypothetical protein MUC68_09805 [Burkholderiaceae bacterium]|nr:hypothetical protein [Burkholderiaceae bacterium]
MNDKPQAKPSPDRSSRPSERNGPLPAALDPHVQQQDALDEQAQAAGIPTDPGNARRPPGAVAGDRRTDAPEPKPGLDPHIKDAQVG